VEGQSLLELLRASRARATGLALREERGPYTGDPRPMASLQKLTRLLAFCLPWHLRKYFPNLLSQSQLNRRVRALEPEMRALQRYLAEALIQPSAVYHIVDTTLIPVMVRVRACRKGLFAGQATFGRCRSKTEWVYGFKVALGGPLGEPGGRDLRLWIGRGRRRGAAEIGDFLVAQDRHDAYLLADKGFSSVAWEQHWLQSYGALVAATPKDNSKRAWPEADRRWASGKRQLIEGVIDQLKDLFALERHRAKRRWVLFWPAWLPRLRRPTPAASGSTTSLVGRCGIWPTSWFEKLCISRLILLR
jgi:hypothetical protein